MAIRNVPDFPLRSSGLSQDAYSTAVEASLSQLPGAISDINATATVAQLATTTTSSSSVLIGTGAKTFTVPSGLGFVVGMTLRIANTSTAYMTGDVTSYSSTTLVVNVTSVVGSGTFASWTISLAAVGANTAGSVSFTPAGNIAATNVQTAIQELDTEKLSSAAGAVTGTNLEDITTAETVGSAYDIPVVTKDINGRVTTITTAAKVTSGAVIATTSGIVKSYTSIPSGVKKITLMLSGVSTNGTSGLAVQIGDSGGIENTGYLGSSSNMGATVATNNYAFGFGIFTNAATRVMNGSMVLTLLDASTNTWTAMGIFGDSSTNLLTVSAGSKSLSSTLTQIDFSTGNGADVFDAGSINILLE